MAGNYFTGWRHGKNKANFMGIYLYVTRFKIICRFSQLFAFSFSHRVLLYVFQFNSRNYQVGRS